MGRRGDAVRATKTVLLVDPDDATRRSTTELLVALGFRVQGCGDGQGALARAVSKAPDVWCARR